MSSINIRRTNDVNTLRLRVFRQIYKRLEEVAARAFALFEQRGRQTGHELEDWVRAEHEIMGGPAAELVDDLDAYEFRMALPGFDASRVEVTVTPTVIAVHAGKEPEIEAEQTRILWSEFGPKDVYRQFQTPQQIDVLRTTAILDRGVLKITAAKAVATKANSMAVVKAASAIPVRWVAA